MENIEELEAELALCNQEIDQLRTDKQLKAEETVRAQTVRGCVAVRSVV